MYKSHFYFCFYFILNTFISLSIINFITLANPLFAGDEDLFGSSGSSKNNNSPAISDFKMNTSLGVDARLVKADRHTSWAKGGRGLTRYGAIRDDQGAIYFALPQIFLVHELYYQNSLNSHIQINYSDHSDDVGKLGIVEAYLQRKSQSGPSSWNMNARAGILIPPLSLEHPKTGWSTKWTITPSAINSWVGEELRAVGAEIKFKKKFLSLTGAAFSGNDPAGTILSWRGWALHDYQGTYGSRLKIQSNNVNSSVTWDSPYKELDGRVGFYGDATYKWGGGKLSFFYYNNLANSTAMDATDYAWHTDFWNISFRHNWKGKLDFLAQYMKGTTGMGNHQLTVKNDFNAWYVLLSYQMSMQDRLSFRFDAFQVDDKDGWKNSSNKWDKNDSKGKAFTLAFMHNIDEITTLGLEYLHVISERVGNVPYGLDDPKDHLLQAMMRVIF